jgi:hypothetical protein
MRRSKSASSCFSRFFRSRRLVDVLQVALAEREHRDARRERRPHQRTGRLRQEHVTAAAGAAETRGAHDVEPEVALLADRRLARVQPDPHVHRDPAWPVVRDVRPLHLGRRRDRVARAHEREEERVALRVDLDAVVRGERAAHEPPVIRQHLGVAVAQLLEQRGRALDVGEGEGDGAAGKLGHDPILDVPAPASSARATGQVYAPKTRARTDRSRVGRAERRVPVASAIALLIARSPCPACCIRSTTS